jgi:hypothetical protein
VRIFLGFLWIDLARGRSEGLSQNGIVPEWNGVTGLGLQQEFVGFGWWGSSILGIVGL